MDEEPCVTALVQCASQLTLLRQRIFQHAAQFQRYGPKPILTYLALIQQHLTTLEAAMGTMEVQTDAAYRRRKPRRRRRATWADGGRGGLTNTA